MPDPLSLTIGPLQPDSDWPLDTRPAAVDRWAASLHLANVGETARLLHHLLRDAVHYDIPLRHRFHLLERIAEPLHAILPQLQQHYADIGLPLDQHAQSVAALYSQMVADVITNYRLLLRKQSSNPGQIDNRIVIHALQRTLFYARLLLRNQQYVGIAPHRGLWRLLHGLYLFAEKHQLTHHHLEDLAGRASDIETEYKALLLAALTSPLEMRSSQIAELDQHLHYWSALTRPLDSHQRGDNFFCVQLDQDRPPPRSVRQCERLCQKTPTRRRFDTGRLMTSLNEALMGGGEKLALGNGGYASRTLLEYLRQAWARPQTRHRDRIRVKHNYDLLIGLSSIHEHMHFGNITLPIAEEQATPLPQCEGVGLWHGRFKWHTQPYWLAATEQEHPTTDGALHHVPGLSNHSFGQQIEFPSFRASMRDISDTGYRFSLNLNRGVHLTVGQIVAVRRDDHFPWEVGEVRWEEPGDKPGSVLFGVHRLLAETIPLPVYIKDRGGQLIEVSGLLGIHENGQPGLLVPTIMRLKEKRLFIRGQGREITIDTTEPLAHSINFQLFTFDDPHFGHAESIIDLQWSNPPQTARPSDPPNADGNISPAKEHFAHLWNRL